MGDADGTAVGVAVGGADGEGVGLPCTYVGEIVGT